MPNSSQLRRKRIYRAAIAPKAFLGNSEVTKDLPISESSGEFTKSFFINSGLLNDSTEEREFQNIHASDIPVPPGSQITDYDGVSHTINRLTDTFLTTKNRLEWLASALRQQQHALHQKECFLADYEGRKRPAPLKEIPFFEEMTDPGTVLIIRESLVNRIGIIWAGITAGAFILMCLYKLIF